MPTEPVDGTFTVDGGHGERSYLFLTGSPGDLDATIVAMVSTDGAQTSGGGDEEAGSRSERDLAIEQVTLGLSANLPVDDAQATRTAELLVDAIGVDNLVIDGEFVDLDSLPAEFDSVAEQAIIQAVAECDINPAELGG